MKNIAFEGPVLETILQKHEYLDGSGPNALSGDELLLAARILTTTNYFVAMISPRASGDSLTIETALAALLKDAGSRYDRQAVASLFHVTENKLDIDSLQYSLSTGYYCLPPQITEAGRLTVHLRQLIYKLEHRTQKT